MRRKGDGIRFDSGEDRRPSLKALAVLTLRHEGTRRRGLSGREESGVKDGKFSARPETFYIMNNGACGVRGFSYYFF